MALILSIEGNIGTGKSTIIENLKKYNTDKKIYFVPEPIDIWETIVDSPIDSGQSGKTILELFYTNNKQFAFSFQMMAYISRVYKLKEAIKNNPESIIITERSILTDRHVFAKMLYDNGDISNVDYRIYLEWFDYFIKEIPISGIIHMHSNPETCMKRIKKRNRTGEVMEQNYLVNCDKYHQDWLRTCQLPKLKIDCNKDTEVENDTKKWCGQILDFVDHIEYSSFIVSELKNTKFIENDNDNNNIIYEYSDIERNIIFIGYNLLFFLHIYAFMIAIIGK